LMRVGDGAARSAQRIRDIQEQNETCVRASANRHPAMSSSKVEAGAARFF
jgi:hypothetical protein